MKKGKLTKVGIFLLVVSFLLWVGAIVYIFLGYGKLITTTNIGWGELAGSLQLLVAEGMILSTAAMPIFFAEMFSAQAKGKTRGAVIGAVLLIALLVYENVDIAEIFNGGESGSVNFANLLVDLVVPALAILAILLSNRPLAIIMAILSIGTTAVSVMNALGVSAVFSLNGTGYTSSALSQVSGAISVLPVVAEIVYGLGMFFGLLGVKKIEK